MFGAVWSHVTIPFTLENNCCTKGSTSCPVDLDLSSPVLWPSLSPSVGVRRSGPLSVGLWHKRGSAPWTIYVRSACSPVLRRKEQFLLHRAVCPSRDAAPWGTLLLSNEIQGEMQDPGQTWTTWSQLFLLLHSFYKA
ncbi:hypothetical protein OYC64_001000 [Pagothenia borchgrevinki]|uniref:Uncharacterized protein n=1 Tax=Pagothenia borchgrevinki TaxID=8213 RepID=A0ABD2HEA8_PAGBO